MIVDERLSHGINQLGLEIAVEHQQQLLEYLKLLEKWNTAYNLTAVRDFSAMVTHHLLDSLSIHNYLNQEFLMDVGSGAGLPGLVMAIVNPHQQWRLLDSNGKKTRFLQQVVLELKLTNVEVVHSRMELYQTTNPPQTIVSRALGSLNSTISAIAHLCTSQTRLWFMKGCYPTEELAALSAEYRCLGVYRLTVPGLNAERHLVEIMCES